MQTFILLFRGINVGGNNKLPMKELKALLSELGYQQVQSYIQSGNVVLKATSVDIDLIGQRIAQQFGFTPKIMPLTTDALSQSITNNPYSSFAGNTVQFYFCQQTPSFNEDKATDLATNGEEFLLVDKVLYLHAPNGIGRSKLAAKLEDYLGVSTTVRNLNTVEKLKALTDTA
ncbi:DUF1697 domain-containing protein [Thalassotalea sp. G2M2-11]|uniref:DUF1697 domain-containing protein n=1 Tax=Thalassotalea sp. G2M2-11 TaxID=2787627 RepID=UPI0019D0493D|nr:DUF1697 domain-containing protein [Thalassotalea sp. G2M2-11]